VRNWFRGGGPEYAEVVADVCHALGVEPQAGVVAAEEALLKELVRRALATMSEADEEILLRQLRAQAGRPVGVEEILLNGEHCCLCSFP
jgi:uncharacterized protein YaaW (UPF0174 family)